MHMKLSQVKPRNINPVFITETYQCKKLMIYSDNFTNIQDFKINFSISNFQYYFYFVDSETIFCGIMKKRLKILFIANY